MPFFDDIFLPTDLNELNLDAGQGASQASAQPIDPYSTMGAGMAGAGAGATSTDPRTTPAQSGLAGMVAGSGVQGAPLPGGAQGPARNALAGAAPGATPPVVVGPAKLDPQVEMTMGKAQIEEPKREMDPRLKKLFMMGAALGAGVKNAGADQKDNNGLLKMILGK